MDQRVTSKVAEVLMHHLTALKMMQLDELMLDYAEDAVLMAPNQIFRGPAEIRGYFSAALASSPPEMIAAIEAIDQKIHGEVAYVVWSAEPFVKIATDTFVIRDGKIAAQTFLMVS